MTSSPNYSVANMLVGIIFLLLQPASILSFFGGSEVKSTSAMPWTAYIKMKPPYSGVPDVECMGSIVSKNTVLTAYDCVAYDGDLAELHAVFVAIGGLSRPSSNGIEYTNPSGITYPDDDDILGAEFDCSRCRIQLAILKIKYDLQFSADIQAIELNRDASHPRLNDYAFVTGTYRNSKKLHFTRQTVLDPWICKGNREFICAGSSDRSGPTESDYGTGLIIARHVQSQLVGVLITQDKSTNGTKEPRYMYEHIVDYVEWIDAIHLQIFKDEQPL